MNMEQLYIFDWSKVKPEVIEGISKGLVELRDGVAYKLNEAGHFVITQHMPLKEVSINSSSNIEGVLKHLNAAQNIQLAATAISTGLILGAIVVQTMYLANKIDKLQDQIDLVSQDVHSQNVLYFMGKLSEYFGLIESARVLLLDKALVEESQGIAEQYMAQLAAKRNELLSLIDNLIDYVDTASERHAKLMFDFVNMMMDILPKTISLETQLYERYGKYKMADHILATSAKSYTNILTNYKTWCNSKIQEVISGNAPQHMQLMNDKEDLLKELFNSEINQAILTANIKKNLEYAPVSTSAN
ncbi:hypothetical protein [Pseudoalteromonas sp. NGC95]|uniref:hypothetical protein n=1 Tax=Pseudoalteromonas sp. NGC95 TaxID=2792051 RepID=UPI0018CDAC64|nr:hypothetical protein [Pseudoalteromonas sp. NGC95]MBH0017833.1 hypothetical protein [Pseudoalteromonas sp. NGC95]